MSEKPDPTVIVLAPEDQKRLAEAILSPPPPTDALKRAAQAHARLVPPAEGKS